MKYFPQLDVEFKTTAFGAREASHPDIYDTPIKVKTDNIINSVCFDALECLRPIWGDNIMENRDLLYILVSGSVPAKLMLKTRMTADEYYNRLFLSYYNRFPQFKNTVDLAYFFGDPKYNLNRRTIAPIRERIDANIQYAINKIESVKTGKVLMVTHDKVYGAFRTKIDDELFKDFKIIKNV